MDDDLRALERRVAGEKHEPGARLALLNAYERAGDKTKLHAATWQGAQDFPLDERFIPFYHRIHAENVLYLRRDGGALVLEALVGGSIASLCRRNGMLTPDEQEQRPDTHEVVDGEELVTMHSSPRRYHLFETPDDVFLARNPLGEEDPGQVEYLLANRTVSVSIPGDFSRRVIDVVSLGGRVYVRSGGDVMGMPAILQNQICQFGQGLNPEVERARGYTELPTGNFLSRLFGERSGPQGALMTWMMPFKGALYFCEAPPREQSTQGVMEANEGGRVVAVDSDAESLHGESIIRAHDLLRGNAVYAGRVVKTDGSSQEFNSLTDGLRMMHAARQARTYAGWFDSPFARRGLSKVFPKDVLWHQESGELTQGRYVIATEVRSAVPISSHMYDLLRRRFA